MGLPAHKTQSACAAIPAPQVGNYGVVRSPPPPLQTVPASYSAPSSGVFLRPAQPMGSFCVGAKVEAWSKSYNMWCHGVVDHVEGGMIYVCFEVPGGDTFLKGIPEGHPELRFCQAQQPSIVLARPAASATSATPRHVG